MFRSFPVSRSILPQIVAVAQGVRVGTVGTG